MANPNDQHEMDDHRPGEGGAGEFDVVPVDHEPLEVEPPRRAASAQFVVEGEVGSDAALREAMDPANQSLADALRLSFRVLQMVILVLVVLFFLSGFQTVGDSQGGVLTRWGKIVPVSGQDALEPGLKFSRWPYPVGEFVIIETTNRSVDLRETFWPNLGGRSLEDAAEGARVQNPIHPDREGYVITRDGDIAHVQLTARYRVDDTVDFLHHVRDSNADRLVRLALQRAVVHVAATMSLQELVDLRDELRDRVQANAQAVLDGFNSGIALAVVNVSDTTVPLAIRNAFGEVQSARVESERTIESARQDANRTLVYAAGERYRDVIRLINRFEDATQLGDEDRAEDLLVQINEVLDGDMVSGEVAQIVQQARAYRAMVESTLGNEARRFASLLPVFRQHPDLVVRQRWLQAYANVLNQEDAEVFFVPGGMGVVNLELSGSHEIKELRQKLQLDRREEESLMRSFDGRGGQYIPWARDIQLQGPGRQLDRSGRPERQPGSPRR